MQLASTFAAIPPKTRTAIAALIIGASACGLRASLDYMHSVDALYLYGLLSMLAETQLYYLLLLFVWSAETPPRRALVYGVPIVVLALAESRSDRSDLREVALHTARILLSLMPPGVLLGLIRRTTGARLAPPYEKQPLALRDLFVLTFVVALYLSGWRLIRQANGDAFLPSKIDLSDAAVSYSFALTAAAAACTVFRTRVRLAVVLLAGIAGLQLALLLALDAWDGLALISTLLRGRPFNLVWLDITHVVISLIMFTLYFLYLRRRGEQLLFGASLPLPTPHSNLPTLP